MGPKFGSTRVKFLCYGSLADDNLGLTLRACIFSIRSSSKGGSRTIPVSPSRDLASESFIQDADAARLAVRPFL